MLACGTHIHVQPGETLFHQGDRAERCFLVLGGRLRLSKLHEQGKEVILRYLGPGELVAALAACRGADYLGTAQAVEPTELMSWDRETIEELMLTHPPLVHSLLQPALDRMNDIQSRYLELCAEQVAGRLARALLRIMEHAGRKTEAGITIDFPLSREDLASYVGTTLYTVSRTLSAWEKKGWIVSGRERIVITNPHALMEFAEGY